MRKIVVLCDLNHSSVSYQHSIQVPKLRTTFTDMYHVAITIILSLSVCTPYPLVNVVLPDFVRRAKRYSPYVELRDCK